MTKLSHNVPAHKRPNATQPLAILAKLILALIPTLTNAQTPNQPIRYFDSRCIVLRCEGRFWNAIALYIDAAPENQHGVWIDRNGNGIYDPATDIGPDELQLAQWHEYYFITPELRIYGGVRELQCDYSDPMRLDLRANPALEKLNCEGNRLLELKLETNTNLQWLNCNNNVLYALNLANLTNLQHLECAGNQLQTLNLKNLNNLKDLDISYNPIKALDLTQLTELERLDCRNANLRHLNLTTNANLRMLDCGGNRLTQLNLSNLTKLQTLACPSNRLTNLDLTTNTTLKQIIAYNNLLTQINLPNAPLLYLDCHANRLSFEAMDSIVKAIPEVVPSPLAPMMPQPSRGLAAIAYPEGVLWAQANNDANRITPQQIAEARDKGWRVITNRGETNANSTDGISTPTDRGLIEIMLSQPLDTIYLRLAAPPEDQTQIWIDTDANATFNDDKDLNATQLRYDKWQPYPIRGSLRIRLYGPIHELEIQPGTPLAALETLANPELKLLACPATGLMNLYTRGNPLLQYLDCRGNPLGALDLTYNEQLRTLHCDGIGLPALNIRANKLLETLTCAGNTLRALDLSRNPNLAILDCANNRIARLELQRNRKLRLIHCPDNRMQTLNVPQLDSLQSLSIAGNRLPYRDLANLIDHLPTIDSAYTPNRLPPTYRSLHATITLGGPENATPDSQLLQFIQGKRWKIKNSSTD